jgi:hypothetical protein
MKTEFVHLTGFGDLVEAHAGAHHRVEDNVGRRWRESVSVAFRAVGPCRALSRLRSGQRIEKWVDQRASC